MQPTVPSPPDWLADLLVLQDLAPQKNFPGGLPLSFAQETCPPERSFAVSMAGEWPRALPPEPAGKEGGWRSSKGFTGQAQRGPVTHSPSVEATLVPEQRRVGSGWGAVTRGVPATPCWEADLCGIPLGKPGPCAGRPPLGVDEPHLRDTTRSRGQTERRVILCEYVW